jgi:Heterokaryon incompatibility protein (HET)
MVPNGGSLADIYRIFADDPMSRLLWSRQPSSDPQSDVFFSQMQIWVDTCLTKHELCRSDGGNVWETLTGSTKKRDRLAATLPARVIDVGDNETSPSLFISQGTSGHWIALSHCWGEHQPLKLESKSISAFTDGISLDIMPPMFQDAVFITRRLGFRYLWIDCLCIVQDSREDWLAESLRMGNIYKNAVITIAAEAAEDSSVGILGSTGRGRIRVGNQQPRDVIQLSSHSAAHSIQGNLILTAKSAMKIVPDAQGPLSARKWVLQEEILSTRLLRFAEGQVWWQCRELQCNERFPFGYKASTGSFWDKDNIYIRQGVEWSSVRSFLLTSRRGKTQKRGNNKIRLITSQQIRWYWYNTVNEYCRRRMTYDADTLPAISGIAKEYQRQLFYTHKSYEYKAGIWVNDLPQGLLWYTPQPGATTTSPYVAPSWSWASIRSGPYYNRRLLEDLIPDDNLIHLFGPRRKPRGIAAVLDIDMTMRQEDPFGQVQSGFMRLQGPCHELCRCSIPASFFDCFTGNEDVVLDYSNVQQMFNTTEGNSMWTDICTVSDFAGQACKQGANIQHSRCLVVHIISSKRLARGQKIAFALILEQVEDVDNKYRRIGLAMLLENTKSSKIWPTREITII